MAPRYVTSDDLKEFELKPSLKDEPLKAHSSIWGSCRLTYTICAFLATLNLMFLRFNLSFAIVCMVKDGHQHKINSSLVTGVNETAEDEDTCRPSAVIPGQKPYPEGEFEWEKDIQGMLLSGFFYGYILSQVLGGWLSDRFGGKIMFIGGNATQAFLSLLAPMAARWSYQTLFWLRVFQGIVAGFSLPAIYQLFSRWAAPKERGTLMAVAYSGFPLGNCIVFPLASFLCQSGLWEGWPSTFYVPGIIGLVCSLCFCFLVFDNPDRHPRISDEEKRYLMQFAPPPVHKKGTMSVPWRHIATSLPMYAYMIVHFCQNWGFIMLAVNLPLFMKDVLNLDISQNGILSASPYAGIMMTRFFVGWTFDLLRKKNFCRVTTLRKIYHTIGTIPPALSMIAMGFVSCKNQYLAVAVICISQTAADVAYVGGYMLSLLDMAPQYSGMLTGLTNSFGSIPGFIVPTLVGILTPNGTREEWMIVLYITAGFYFLGFAIYTLFGSSELQWWAIQTGGQNDTSGEKDYMNKNGSLILNISIDEIAKEKELMLLDDGNDKNKIKATCDIKTQEKEEANALLLNDMTDGKKCIMIDAIRAA